MENILEELSEPGEWCLDPEERMLYFKPPNKDFDPTAVEVPALDCLVRLRDVQFVTLRGLTFTGTTTGDDYHRQGVQGIGAMVQQQGWVYAGEALHLRGTRYCLVEGCTFDQVGGNAIYLERGNYRTHVRRNTIAYAGVNGIVLAGDRPFHSLFCELTDNEIHHVGAFINLVAGVFLGTSDGCRVAHNYFHDLPHHAVNLASNGLGRNYVEFNEIRRVCLAISDTGAINSWMDTPGPWVEVHDERSGHVIRYNLIVDVPGCKVEKGKVVEDWTTRWHLPGRLHQQLPGLRQPHRTRRNRLPDPRRATQPDRKQRHRGLQAGNVGLRLPPAAGRQCLHQGHVPRQRLCA